MFSSEQYRSLREGAGLVPRPGRGQLSLAGADRLTFLQGLLTNDIQALEPGGGCYAAMLSANGRMIADMRVFEVGGATLLDVAAAQAEALRERFDRLIFSEDVQVEDVSKTRRELGLYGPLAAGILASTLVGRGTEDVSATELDGMALYSCRLFAGADGQVIVLRSDDAGIGGFDLIVDVRHVEAVAAGLRTAGAADIDAETADVTRIEGGRPLFGADMDEDTIPLEAGIEGRAISLTKGCYVGQEIIIRVLHRGQGRVARRLVGLTFEPSGMVPVRGDVVRAGDRQIGAVTSAARSPALGRPVAMAYVHRDFTEPSTRVAVGPEGSAQPAVVAALPLVGTLVHDVGVGR